MTSDKITTVTGTDDRAVALIASDGADRDHLAGLVKKLGYGVNTYPNAAEFDRCDEPSRAAIICFRVASATSRVPDMPETLRGQRVLVYSDLSEERHIVEALNAGAHHFFRIDESMNVMLARMGAALRRYDRVRVDSLSVPPFRFDLARRRVSLDGKPLELSPREFDLAFYLFANRDRIVTNSELLTSVWSLPKNMDTRRIDTAACRVRGKMSLGDRTGWVLRRFRSEGYGLYSDTRDSEKPVPLTQERREAEVD